MFKSWNNVRHHAYTVNTKLIKKLREDPNRNKCHLNSTKNAIMSLKIGLNRAVTVKNSSKTPFLAHGTRFDPSFPSNKIDKLK